LGCPLGSGKLQYCNCLYHPGFTTPTRATGEATARPPTAQPRNSLDWGNSPHQNRIPEQVEPLQLATFHQFGLCKFAEKVFSQGSRNKTQGKKQEKEKAFSQGSRDKTLGGK